MYLIFETELCKLVVRSPMVHLHKIGGRLKELSEQNENVKEYLTEIVDGWEDYLIRLYAYKQTSEGKLFEDPRTIEID